MPPAADPPIDPPIDPLRAYLWSARVLVVSAPDIEDNDLRLQDQWLGHDAEGQAERELVVLRAVGQSGTASVEVAAIRERLSMAPDRFEVVLVGKDGGVALRRRQPAPLDELFARIDAMPMRREDLRRRQAACGS